MLYYCPICKKYVKVSTTAVQYHCPCCGTTLYPVVT